MYSNLHHSPPLGRFVSHFRTSIFTDSVIRISSLIQGRNPSTTAIDRTCKGSDRSRELWHPPGARGVYGGAVIAQCLSAAQQTIPPPSPTNGNAVFLIHSMHCYFVLAGDSAIPILYHVEKVRDGKSFMTRTVQARQKGRAIFTTTLSFVREGSAGPSTISHAWDMPLDAVAELDKALGEISSHGDADAEALGVQGSGPFVTKRLAIENSKRDRLLWQFGIDGDRWLTLCICRYFNEHPVQEDSSMAQSPRSHIVKRWATTALVGPRVHVRQLLHWNCCACAQLMALLIPR